MEEAILTRLDRLEAQNRRLKRAGVGALVIAAAVLLMGQARPVRTVEAQNFLLKDANGTVRARLSIELADRPTLSLLDAHGSPLVSLAGGQDPFLTLNRAGSEEQVTISVSRELSGLAVYGKDKGGPYHGLQAGLGVVKGTPGVDLFGEHGEQVTLNLETGMPKLLLFRNGASGFLADTESIQISDGQGFQAVLGTTNLQVPRTGETRKTSAASIVLFGKD
jgi:hypothetical protein